MIKSLVIYLSAFLMLVIQLSSCHPVNDLGFSCQDQQDMMSTALTSKYFLENYKELRQFGRSDGKIYIIDTLAEKDECIRKMKHSTELKFTDNFDFDRTFLEQAKDPRFAISMPEFKKHGDTIYLQFYYYKGYSKFDYKFLKQNKNWKLIFENETMQKVGS